MLELDYPELYKQSNLHQDKFWHEIAQQVVWHKPYASVISNEDPIIPNWFVGGEINMSYNCLDRAIDEGHGDDVAVIYEGPVRNTTEKITYKQLLHSVELLAGVMVDKCGMKKGDIALLYFPVIPQGLISMLACTRIGVIYSPMFGGFSPKAISIRINHIKPKVILTSNMGFETYVPVNYKKNVDEAIAMSECSPDHCIIYNRPNTQPSQMIEGRDLDWKNEMKQARLQAPIPVESSHPLYIIYTSGTTGQPKGCVIGTGNLTVINKYLLKYMFDLKPGECFWMYSDFGWGTGQSLMSFGPLLCRLSTILYEGQPVTTPDAGQICRILNRNKAVSFMASPTILRMLRNNASSSDLELTYSGLRDIYLAGEVSEENLQQWIRDTFKCSLFDLWSQTELCYSATSAGYGFKRKEYQTSVLMPNMNPVVVHNETGEILPVGTPGRLLLKKPFVPSMVLSFYKDHDRFLRTYFHKYPGYYDTMDWAVMNDNGTFKILSRADDVIQVASERVCGTAVEEICLKHEDVIEAAVVPLDDCINGQIPFAFLVKSKSSSKTDEEVINETIELVNKSMGEFILFSNAVIVPDLPKTKSGKLSRVSLSSMVNGREFKMPLNVENASIYPDIFAILIKHKYGAKLPVDFLESK